MLPLEKRLARQAQVLPLDDFPGQRQQNKGKMLPLSHFSRQREQWAEGAGWSRGKREQGQAGAGGKSNKRRCSRWTIILASGSKTRGKCSRYPTFHASGSSGQEQWAVCRSSGQQFCPEKIWFVRVDYVYLRQH